MLAGEESQQTETVYRIMGEEEGDGRHALTSLPAA